MNLPFRIHTATQHDLKDVKALFRRYAEWMEYEICFDTFEEEIAGLPGKYSPPGGFLLVAKVEKEAIGCIALMQISKSTAKMKRLWVTPKYRNLKVGYALIQETISKAKKLHYSKIQLETTPKMDKAVSVYKQLGFKLDEDQGELLNMTKTI